jgi:hypothetical protein
MIEPSTVLVFEVDVMTWVALAIGVFVGGVVVLGIGALARIAGRQ